jgi:alpha-L-fucosidase
MRPLAQQFKPVDFDPEEWVDLIVKSGARYAGIAAMHHDGYAMWDSDVIRLDAGELGPERDLLGEILAAIKARGLKTMTSFHHARTFRHFEVCPYISSFRGHAEKTASATGTRVGGPAGSGIARLLLVRR